MTLLLYFEAFSLSVHELLTTLLRQTKNCQQATNELLLIGATVKKANKLLRMIFAKTMFCADCGRGTRNWFICFFDHFYALTQNVRHFIKNGSVSVFHCFWTVYLVDRQAQKQQRFR